MRHTLVTTLALCTLAVPIALALRPAPPSPTQDAVDQEPTVLQQSMGTLMRGQKGLRKLVGDLGANSREIIETVGAMQDACITALGQNPPARDGMSAADAAVFNVGFKRTMVKLLDQVLEMHEAALKGDGEALSAAYAALNPIKKAGHDTYQ